jgi:hypothetical protein
MYIYIYIHMYICIAPSKEIQHFHRMKCSCALSILKYQGTSCVRDVFFFKRSSAKYSFPKLRRMFCDVSVLWVSSHYTHGSSTTSSVFITIKISWSNLVQNVLRKARKWRLSFLIVRVLMAVTHCTC